MPVPNFDDSFLAFYIALLGYCWAHESEFLQ